MKRIQLFVRQYGFVACMLAGAAFSACADPGDSVSGAGDERVWSISNQSGALVANGRFRVTTPNEQRTVGASIRMSGASRGDFDEISFDIDDNLALVSASVIEEQALARLAAGGGQIEIGANLDNQSYTYQGKTYYNDDDLKTALRDSTEISSIDFPMQGAALIVADDADAIANNPSYGMNRKPVGRFFKKVFTFIFDHVSFKCSWTRTTNKDGTSSSRDCNVGSR